ncbi:Fe-S cluster assembly protein SufD [Pseudoclavibacter endophyticus]|uniref:Fe-S cluster assembly protein SufD n=1 Tax=Pseudoclavibacter endophyticus TaxID=1778590 RepID=A0A6H9WUI2_9MICO|nr:Fe-S cluster assembly protein SufD [Pseudoclavibacter endophyticus]KAB1650144.1 Fe-S cluster assembly protein SufD [Pseudoclavibacter endophyticus]GGA56784.1 Fe-S cluster assembly protein SufD [Pseudoclavibacter endophyticus]
MTTPTTTTASSAQSGAAPGEQRNALGQNAHAHGRDPFVPVQTRSERPSSTNPADFADVTGREAEWKYSPVAKLHDLISGELAPANERIDDPGVEGVTISRVSRDDARIGTAGIPEDKASANAFASFGEALVIEVSGEDDKVALIDRSGFGNTPAAAHTIVDIKPHAQALLVLRHTGPAALAENVEFLVGEGARVTVVSLQEWEDGARHLSSHFAAIERDAYLKHVVVSLGGDIVRLNSSAHLNAPGADGELFGLYFADAGQHLEQQVFMDHNAPKTRSRVNYKGALQGEGARSVWIGDVLIRANADGTDSYEQNRNLVLSDGARADSVPNLEIETGNIEGAGHASATGRFDDEHLFYLMSRGIAEAEARRMVAHGFLNEIVQEIGNDELAERLNAIIEQELYQSTGRLLGAS